jgi:hypothetical protein
MKEVNPLESLEFFYISPYMPDNFIMLGLAKREKQPTGIFTLINGHFVPYFNINDLIDGTVHIKWRSKDNFVINHKIYCKIVEKNVIRIDTVL